MARLLSIRILSRKATSKIARARKEGWFIVDVTSNSEDSRWVQFSPFYPLDDLVVPGQPDGTVSRSVEGAWQGLKVFEREGVDLSKLKVANMKGLKRPAQRSEAQTKKEGRGAVVGHQYDGRTIGYLDARKLIYLPLYSQVIDRLAPLLREMKRIALEKHNGLIVLLDYVTNGDVDDLVSPLSHASLVLAALLRLP